MFVPRIAACLLSVFTSAPEVDMYKEIDKQARLHMKPELAACTNLECVDDLLHAKELKTLKRVVELSGRSVEEQKLFMERYRDAKQKHKQLIEKSDVQNHDTKRLSKHTLDTTKYFLEQSDIDSRKVRINANNFRMRERAESLGASYGASEKGAAYIEYHSKDRKEPDEHIIAHEVIHIEEGHSFKRNMIDDFAQTFEVDIFKADTRDVHYYFTKLRRVYEMQAELRPLLRFKDKKLPAQLLESTMPQCEYWYEQGHLSKVWNKPANGISTHPGCTELLPYIIKIEDLKKQGAVPLYEKVGKGSKTA